MPSRLSLALVPLAILAVQSICIISTLIYTLSALSSQAVRTLFREGGIATDYSTAASALPLLLLFAGVRSVGVCLFIIQWTIRRKTASWRLLLLQSCVSVALFSWVMSQMILVTVVACDDPANLLYVLDMHIWPVNRFDHDHNIHVELGCCGFNSFSDFGRQPGPWYERCRNDTKVDCLVPASCCKDLKEPGRNLSKCVLLEDKSLLFQDGCSSVAGLYLCRWAAAPLVLTSLLALLDFTFAFYSFMQIKREDRKESRV